MSKTMDTLFTCPVCRDKGTVKFTKPSFIKSTMVNHECVMCECDFEITLSKPRGGKSASLVDVQVRITAVSDYALENHDADGSMKKIVQELENGPLYAHESPMSEELAKEKEMSKGEAC